MVFTAAKIPRELKYEVARFISTYNSIHAKKAKFYSLNYSDLVRLALADFLDNRHPSQFFIPGDSNGP